MKLHNGQEVEVRGEISLDGKKFMICKLAYPTYVNGTMVRYINLPMSEFKNYCEEVKRQSDEITYMMETEDVIIDRTTISETNKTPVDGIQREGE